jgi:hypothetical protein
MKKIILKISILLIFLSLAGCLTAEQQKIYDQQEKDYKMRQQARFDAEQLNAYPNLPDCYGYQPQEWTKVVYTKDQGYCILRKPIAFKSQAIANTGHKTKKKIPNPASIEFIN